MMMRVFVKSNCLFVLFIIYVLEIFYNFNFFLIIFGDLGVGSGGVEKFR